MKARDNLRLYNCWIHMRHRCNNPKTHNFHRYGGRGITMCEGWAKYDAFYEWAISSGYQNHLTIERINNDGNYCPENCTWIEPGKQSLNRHNVFLPGNNSYHACSGF